MCKNYITNQNIINIIHKNLIMYSALWYATYHVGQ